MLPITFVSLQSLVVQLGLENTTLTPSDQARLKSALVAATARLEQVTGRWLVPRRATLAHSFYRPDELLLKQDLLELVELVNGDGETIPYNAVEQVGEGVIRLKVGQFVRSDSAQPILVRGVWGWRGDWRQSGDTVNGAVLNPLLIPVQNVNGLDVLGNSPRFLAGQLIRVGDEFMSVLAADGITQILTVIRGVQGTVTVVPEGGAPIRIYTAPPDVERLILRWAAQLYKAPETDAALSPDLLQEAVSLQRVRVDA